MLDALCPIVFDRTMDNANLVGACREVGSATRKGRTLRSSQGCSAPLFPTFARKENMSRIRTIKPEFFTSEDIVSLTPLARLFYVSLWCEADREGRFEWKPKTLKMRYLPADDCDVSLLCDELVNAGMVELYEVDGRVYAVIPGFTRHQVINNREQSSDIPEPPQKTDACVTRESGRKEGKEGKEGNTRHASMDDDVGFASFWSAFPNKKAKQDAFKAWSKLKPCDALQASILKAVEIQRQGDDWRKEGGRFIPHPATWINGRRWEDSTAQEPASNPFAGVL